MSVQSRSVQVSAGKGRSGQVNAGQCRSVQERAGQGRSVSRNMTLLVRTMTSLGLYE